MKISERAHQRVVVEYLRLLRSKPLFYSVPNGGSRNLLEAVNLKKDGLIPGVPDICICQPNSNHHGLYIEMKTDGGRLTEHQKIFIGRLNDNGYLAQACYSADEAISLLDDYLK